MREEIALLPDGACLQIRPLRPEDRARLCSGYAQLSGGSRYRRFLAVVPKLPDRALRHLTPIDHHDHDALVAVDIETGQRVGVGRYVRSSSQPDLAEVVVTVVEDWRQRGVGTALLRRLASRARDDGIERFDALVLNENQTMSELLRELGPAHRAVDAIEFELPLEELPCD